MSKVNTLLTPTWNRLALNGTKVELPLVAADAGACGEGGAGGVGGDGVCGEGERGACEGGEVAFEHGSSWCELSAADFDAAWAAFEEEARAKSAYRTTLRSTSDVDTAPALAQAAKAKDALDIPAKDAVPRSAVSSALGEEALIWIKSAAQGANTARAYSVANYTNAQEPLVVRVKAAPGITAALVDVLVEKGAHASIRLQADSPAPGTGTVAIALRVIAQQGAHVDIATLQTLDKSWAYLESIEVKTADNAVVDTAQTYLGGGASYGGYGAALHGFRSSCKVKTNYLGAENALDMNFLIRHFGKQTKSDLQANGVLGAQANKSLRATIDLIHGAKGARGHELESVLIADEGAKNKSLPIILCDEDDVQGNHGATIGHVPASQRYYLAARGLDDAAVNALFMKASFEKAYVEAFDAQAAQSVNRLAVAVLGSCVACKDREEAEDTSTTCPAIASHSPKTNATSTAESGE
jgi:Fe-S cluster assembly protein SufD